MVVNVIKWRPWPPLMTKKYKVKIVVKKMEGGSYDPVHLEHHRAVEIRWKGPKIALSSFRKTVKRNFTREEKVVMEPNGVVLWDEEFQSICTLSGNKDNNVFHPWEIAFTVFNMTSLAHGGDAGGDPPGGHWDPPRGHNIDSVKRQRGKTSNKELRDLWRKNGNKPLPIDFDNRDLRTSKPIGPYGSKFISLIGTLVNDNDFPKHYDSWAKVPMESKKLIMPEVQKYFDIRNWFDGGQREVWARAALDWTCKERYKDAKNDFKKDQFIGRGGYDNLDFLRENPPPGVDYNRIWLPFMNRMTDPKFINRSLKNSQNRGKQKFASKHGSRSYALRRDLKQRDDPEHKYPSLLDDYRDHHTDKNGTWVSEEAFNLHRQMMDLRTSSPSASEGEILDEVLGTRSGHQRGRGRKLPFSITGEGSLMTPSSREKRKSPMQEPNVMTTDDFQRYMQALQAANPGIVFPNLPMPSQNVEENEENEENEEEDDDED